jgi:hypothetical protein
MRWEKQDISAELAELVTSPQFKNLQAVMEDMAYSKFMEVQTNPDAQSHADLIANRKILNFYLNLCRDLEFRYRQAEANREAENLARIEALQRDEN